MVKAPHISEWTMVGTLLVHRYSVAGTSTIVHAVYEPSAVIWKHSSITHTDEHGWLGQLGSRPLPEDIDAIPVRVNGTWNQTRFDTIDAWRAGLSFASYEAILAVYPEAAGGKRRDNGEIETTWRG